MKPSFPIPGLILGALALPLLAAPVLGQSYYGDRHRDIPITGAQMTDWPSGRFNVTQSGSFLRPRRHFSQDRAEYRRHYRYENRDNDDRSYYERYDGDRGR